MLSDVMKHLKVKSDLDPDFILRALGDGQYWALKDRYVGIYGPTEPEPSVVSETVRIMGMWQIIESSYGDLSAQDRERLKSEAAPFGDDPKFRGFDANNERHFGVALFHVNQLGNFREFRGRDLSAHMPTIDMHRRMYAEYEAITHEHLTGELSADQLIRILRAAIHPERR
jgi:uncharacterized protein